MKLPQHPRLAKYLNHGILLISIIIGYFITQDFGVSWDEYTQRATAQFNYEYIFEGNQRLKTYPDRDYGVAFEMPVYFLQKALKYTDTRDIYHLRHFCTHLLFLFSCFFGGKLIYLLFKSRWLSTLGMLVLIFCPRIFAHSFFNSKDVPFLSVFIICLYISALVLYKANFRRMILLGLGFGVLINLRIMGGILPLVFLPLFFLQKSAGRSFKQSSTLFLTTFAVAILTTYVSWPFLWEHPISNFGEALNNLVDFRWKGEVLFEGKMTLSENIPWHYLVKWMAITIPIPLLIAAILGWTYYAVLVIQKFRNKVLEEKDLVFVIIFFCFFATVLAISINKSTIYDGWRQVFFLYPLLCFGMLFGIDALHKKWNKVGPVVLGIICSVALFYTIQLHPNQQVYFNALTQRNEAQWLRKNYELDYWGSSYMHAFERILHQDKTAKIKIKCDYEPGKYNLEIIKLPDRWRVELVDSLEEADYFISGYRWHPQEYEELISKIWHEERVFGSSINTTFKLK
ncbi:MAG: hypothetical protein ACI8ZN_002518 [Bacteroidia bacterium]